MLFQVTVTIPSATLVSEPQQTRLAIVRGTITRIATEFPYGCGELAGVRILRGINQIWPVTEGEFVSWDNDIISTTERYPVDDIPLELTIETVNYDALNAHTVTVRVELDPSITPSAPTVLQRLRDLL